MYCMIVYYILKNVGENSLKEIKYGGPGRVKEITKIFPILNSYTKIPDNFLYLSLKLKT